MKPIRLQLILICISLSGVISAQELDKSLGVTVFSGIMNYQGDVKPDNFTMTHSNLAVGVSIRKPLNEKFSLRGGFNTGTITAADRWNPADLKPRNLDFTSTIKEAYLGLEITILDISTEKFAPYIYGGIAVFHFNPWTRDKNGVKTYLQPLSTEGQGLSAYPERRKYKLTQFCVPYGVGARYRISPGINLGIEFNQRKSFTDYIDDVSSSYVDNEVLLREKGRKSWELSYRADELPGSRPDFPGHGEKRGKASEMDWYYFLGLTLEMKLDKIGSLIKIYPKRTQQRCPPPVF